MYVRKLQLLNIRSFPKTSLEFSKGINIIIGTNNSGKSTILRALQKLQNGLTGISKEDVRKTEKTGKIHIQLDKINEEEHSLFQANDNPVITVGEKQDIVFALWNDRKGKEFEQFQFSGNDYKVSLLDNDIKIVHNSGQIPLDDKMNLFIGFPSMEDEDNFIYPFLAKRKVSNYSNQGGRQSAYGIAEQFYNLSSRIQNLENSTHPYTEQYRAICKDILGFAPGKVPGDQNSGDRLGMFVRIKDTIYIESMGEGVANILGLLSILLTENNKLFLIEELENDIHPEALKKLLEIIISKAGNNQFIITTHSNIVLKYLANHPETKIFFTDLDLIDAPKGKKYKIPFSTIKEVENKPKERLEVLTKLGYELFDFDLYTSYILFEEASAEQIVRDFLIPEFVPELINKVRTISTAGTGNISKMFDSFLSLFKYIHTSPMYKHKAWIIADGDSTGKEVLKKMSEKFPDWPERHFINLSEKNFEEYYPLPFKKEFDQILKKFGADRNKDQKQQSKADLMLSVMEYIRKNRKEAIDSFAISAKEVINILKNISRLLQETKTKKSRK